MSSPECGFFLPQELVCKILLLLPIKTLMRFRCVCKSWNSLVFDSTFVKLHLQRSSPNTSILFPSTYRSEKRDSLKCFSIESLVKDPLSTLYDFNLPLPYERGEIIGVCNGLVCFTTKTCTHEPNHTWLQFWNPATRLISQKSYHHSYNTSQCLFYLSMGFGYDDSRDTYKVVAVLMHNALPELETEVRVQCLGDNCSRKVASWIGFPKLNRDNGQYLHGTLNWMARFDQPNQCVIFSFDLRDETYKHFLFPNADFHVSAWELGILRGFLTLSSYDHQTGRLCVWQMKEFGISDSWTQLLSVGCERFQPLCMSQNDHILLGKGFGSFKAVVYNLRDNTFDFFESRNVFLWGFFDYVQSLVLPY